MKDFAVAKQRYLRDPVELRLGALAADLARIGSAAANVANAPAVEVLLEEARRFIEWTAEEVELEAAGELVDLQLTLTLWVRVWENGRVHPQLRALVAHEANCWSERVLTLSRLSAETSRP
jgi:hypothetical protein